MRAVFVAFDLETTGLEPESCEITEIGGYKFGLDRGGGIQRLSSFSTLVQIEGVITPEIERLTHITNDMLKDAAKPQDAIKSFFRWVGLSSIMLAHNASFDTSFLGNAIHKHSLMLPKNPTFCTKRMACRLFPELGHRLSDLETALLRDSEAWKAQRDESQRHRALYDCQLLAHVFAEMVKRRIPKSDWEAERMVKILPSLGGERIRFDRPLNSEELRQEYTEMKWRMA